MKFRTEINIARADQTIQHIDPIITLGSCFAENISKALKEHYFHVLENPFGVLYNPLSIERALRFIIEDKTFTQNDLIFHQQEWHSFWHHSSFSHHDAQVCLHNINTAIQQAHHFLKKARWLIVTFGTAFVYFLKKQKTAVANCHKLPETEFERRLISLAEITEPWLRLLDLLRQFNPQLKIIFSVSPIRHLRDGLPENQKSKATLILATHQLVDSSADYFYFPAYEIVLDDLRDYRFYEADLTHPNQQAVAYIWGKFKAMFFDRTTQQILKEMADFYKRTTHRFRNSASPSAKNFMTETEALRKMLLQKYPYLKQRDF
ncbi:GSCFA domain-containing protein [Caldithrix abyssi]